MSTRDAIRLAVLVVAVWAVACVAWIIVEVMR